MDPSTPLETQAAQKKTKSGMGCLLRGCLITFILGLVGTVGVWFMMVNMVKSQVRDNLNSNPVVQERLGTVQEVKFDIMGTGEAPEDVLVFQLQTARGNASTEVILEVAENGEGIVLVGKIKAPDGKEYDLASGQ